MRFKKLISVILASTFLSSALLGIGAPAEPADSEQNPFFAMSPDEANEFFELITIPNQSLLDQLLERIADDHDADYLPALKKCLDKDTNLEFNLVKLLGESLSISEMNQGTDWFSDLLDLSGGDINQQDDETGDTILIALLRNYGGGYYFNTKYLLENYLQEIELNIKNNENRTALSQLIYNLLNNPFGLDQERRDSLDQEYAEALEMLVEYGATARRSDLEEYEELLASFADQHVPPKTRAVLRKIFNNKYKRVRVY